MKIRFLLSILASALYSTPAICGVTYPIPFPTTIGGTGVTQAQGNGSKVQLSTGSTTTNDCVKFDANGNTIDAGAGCSSGGGGSPGGVTPQLQYNNGGSLAGLPNTTGAYGSANAAALQAISSGMMIDPRNYGAVCAGATFSGGLPVQVGSHNDTAGFEAAEFVAAATGGSVMVPDGCWVSNLQMLSGITLVGQNWAPNYGYDYGVGSIGYTLSLTPGTGYTNGTYLLQASGTETGCPQSGTIGCFNLGLSIGNGSSTSTVTPGIGSATFATPSRTAQANGTYMLIYDNTTVTNGTATNWMFGSVTADTGTSITINVLQYAGSQTSTWSIHLANTLTVSGTSLSGYNVEQAGYGYNAAATIPVPSAAGAGTGGAIASYVRPSGQPFAKPVMYIIGDPAYGINWNGGETIGFVGFEINANSNSSAAGNTSCAGSNVGSSGFGGKIWNFQMSFKGCLYGLYDPTCADYLVSENSDYGQNGTGIGGCFSDFLSEGDTFASNTYGIAGGGDGFGRIVADRFEYDVKGIAPGNQAFLEYSIVGTQFDHFYQCAIDLGGSWNEVNMTGGALKAGGVAGSLTVTGTSSGPGGLVELAVNSAITSLNGGDTPTSTFIGLGTATQYNNTLATSTTTLTVQTGITQTITSSVALGLSPGAPLLLVPTGFGSTNYMYGTINTISGTSFTLNVTQAFGSSASYSSWKIGTPYKIVVAGVGGTTEANGTWYFTYIDGTHILLQGATYVNAYTSGGFGGVQGYDADICLEGQTTGNKAQGLTLSNVQYASSTALGQPASPAYVIETTTAGQFNNYIGFLGGSMFKAGQSGISTNYQSFTLNAENWIVSAPPNYVRDVLGQPKVDTNNINFSQGTTGQIGLQTLTPASGLALDATSDTLGAFGLPEWSTGTRPTITGLNGIGFNTTTGALDVWNGSAWASIGTTWPASGDLVVSNGTNTPAGVAPVNGDCLVASGGAWGAGSCSGSTDTNALYRNLTANFDGGGSALVPGKVIYLSNIPYSGTITGNTLLADESCSATVDVWKVAYASAPPTVSNSIVSGDIPTLSSQQKSNDTTLSGWTTTVTRGDTVAFKLDSSSLCQYLSLTLQVTAN